MSASVELTLASGRTATLNVPAPAQTPAYYFFFMRHLRPEPAWTFLSGLLAAAGVPGCPVARQLAKQKLKEFDIDVASMRRLLDRDGIAFGPLYNLGLFTPELDRPERRAALVVCDPREVLAEILAAMPKPAPSDLAGLPVVAAYHSYCSSLVKFSRNHRRVLIIRREDAVIGLHRVASAIASAWGLALHADTIRKVTVQISNLGRPWTTRTSQTQFDTATLAELEMLFGETLAYFGYVPDTPPSRAFLQHQDDFLLAMRERLSVPVVDLPQPRLAAGFRPSAQGEGANPEASQADTLRLLRRAKGILEPDPELAWRLKRNAADGWFVLGRNFAMDTDDFGCRPVLNQRESGEKIFAAYGCSFTFGAAIPFEETYCSVLQAMFPQWRVENFGTGAYGTAQSLIRLRRNSRWIPADIVTYGFLSDHPLRNVADITWRRRLMENTRAGRSPFLYPRAALADDGSLAFRYVRHPRFDLDGIDLTDFAHDKHYLDLVTAAVIDEMARIVRQSGGHFFVTVLRGNMSAYLRSRLDTAGIPVVEAAVEGQEYTCLPDDAHPNGRAHLVYAERIRDYLLAREAALQGGAPADAPVLQA